MKQFSSLRWKLTLLIIGGSVMTAVISAAGFSWWDLKRFWEHIGAEISAVGNIVADQVAPALVFNDPKSADEILNSLRSDERIRHAVLYSKTKTCFAAFGRDSVKSCPPVPRDGIQRQSGALTITRPVLVGEDRVGTLMLAANVPSMSAFLQQYVSGAALILMLSLVVAAALAIILQSRVSSPILAIATVARRMAEVHRFEERVTVTSSDEVGVLANSFNSMLDEIVRRDDQLADHRKQLELEVAERGRVNAELLQAKEKAEQVAKLKSEFLANMSHEIRTPLNGVTGMIILALDRCTDTTQSEQLCAARTAAESLTSIVNDILDFSKIEAGRMSIESIGFSVRDTVRESLRLFDLNVREKGLKLEATIAAECPGWVQGDPVRLRQILVNLLGNAVKFTSAGGVHLAVGPKANGVLRFEVADTGIGIPQEKLASIFDAFTQADGSHTRRFGGTGLGLAITRRLVTLMGGSLWAESEPGHGSRFIVELPLAATQDNSQAPSKAQAASKHQLPMLHVLVAEDNPLNQRVACGLLKRQGWTVSLAGNGAEAYSCFLREQFDLILLDVQMPEVDGLEAAQMIRSEEVRRGLKRTPILALTAHTSKAEHEQCITHGMDGVVTKPVNVATLLESISGVVKPNNVPELVS